jgi:glutathionylspermidine synthase
MRRVSSIPRTDWQKKVEEAGLIWHTPDEDSDDSGSNAQGGGRPYWNESVFYEFRAKEVEAIECATGELARMALDAAQHVIENQLYARLAIPENAIPLIEHSWQAEPPSLYGRFDLTYDGVHPPKLLEYNADTPTSLVEAAVVQWYWLEEVYPSRDQFNSIHERLVERWKELQPHLPEANVAFCSMDNVEDGMTVAYLLDTAQQAGIAGRMFPIGEIGWNGRTFVGPGNLPLAAVFKLYPWEWMVREEFGQYLGKTDVIWIEPPWKMILSNKGILPVLWKLFPGHPNLLEAHFDRPESMPSWVRKPLLGREGASVTLCDCGRGIESPGGYGAEGFVYQQLAPKMNFDGMHAVIGSWVIGHDEGSAAGMGIRESASPITTNMSQFVPHVLD